MPNAESDWRLSLHILALFGCIIYPLAGGIIFSLLDYCFAVLDGILGGINDFDHKMTMRSILALSVAGYATM